MSKPKIVRYKSGARFVYELDKNTETTYMKIRFDVGAADEKKDSYGVAHFLEHVSFLSTEKLDRQARLDFLNAKGAINNAGTSSLYTSFYLHTLSEYFEESAKVFCYGLSCPKFDKTEIENEKKVILEEYLGNINDSRKMCTQLAFDEMFVSEDVGHPTIGNEKTIKNMTVSKLKAFAKKYTPDKMVVSVCSNLPFKKIKNVVERELGHFIFAENRNTQKRDIETISKPVFVTKDFDVSQINVRVNTKIFDQYDDRRFALTFIIQTLNKRLFEQVRSQNGLVYSIWVARALSEKYGIMTLIFNCKKESIKKVFECYKSCLTELMNDGLKDFEFEKTKNAIKFDMANSKSNVRAKAEMNLSDVVTHDRIYPDSEFMANIEKVTNEDIKAIAKYLLEREAYVVAAVGKDIKKSDINCYKKIMENKI